MFAAHLLGTVQKRLTWWGMKHIKSIALPCNFSRYSPDIARSGTRVLLCNNNANTVESFCTDSGAWVSSEPTNMAPVDLLHEPRMAANDHFTCVIERYTGHVVVKCCAGWTTVQLPKHAGQPVAIAVHDHLAAVCCSKAGGQSIVTICLHTKTVERCSRVSIPCQPDALKFDPWGSSVLMTCGSTVYEYDLSGKLVRTFGTYHLSTGHLDLNFDAQMNILVSDMASKKVVIFDRFGNYKDTVGIGLSHPTAICVHHQFVHILDTGTSNILTFEKM